MWGTVQHDRNISKPIKIVNAVQQDCVLALTFFAIFLSLLPKQAFSTAEEGIKWTRTDGKMSKPSRLKANTKVKNTIIRNILFPDDAAVSAYTFNFWRIALLMHALLSDSLSASKKC